MNRILVVLAVALAVGLSGCSDSTAPESTDPGGTIALQIDLQPAVGAGVTITSATVVATQGATEVTAEMTLDGTWARHTLTNLQPGDYTVRVTLNDGIPVAAAGQGVLTAETGDPAVVTVDFVDWGSLFPELPRRVLFIGNSLTLYNEGLAAHVDSLAASALTHVEVRAEMAAVTRFGLWSHWVDEENRARTAVETGNYDVVVLQPSPGTVVEYPDIFKQSLGLWDELIKASGARTALFVPHSSESAPAYADAIADSCLAAAAEIGAIPIQINRAWYAVADGRPAIDLFHDDIHPTMAGTMVYCYTAFSTLFQHSPRMIGYAYDDAVPIIDRRFMQSACWDAARSTMGW